MYPAQNQSTPLTKRRPYVEHADGNRNYTATVLGKEFKIGAGSVYKYGIFTEDVDRIIKKAPDIARIILKDHIHVSHNAVAALASMSVPDLNKVRSCLADDAMFRLQLTDIDNVITPKRLVPKPIVKATEPEIKQVPKFDPDAEISSLTLTMPSWVSSIYRTCNTAPFALISDKAKQNLLLQISELQIALSTIKKNVEDN